MKKISKTALVFIVLFVFSSKNGVAQEIDTLRGLDLYAVSSISMQNVFDDIITLADECPYFSSRNKEYYISLLLDSNNFQIMVFPLNANTIVYFTKNAYVSSTGVCFYKNRTIVISDYSNNQTLNNFFSSCDTIIDLMFESNENIFDMAFPANTQYEIFYSYDNDTIIRKSEIGEEEAWCGGGDRNSFEYLVRKGDTWESIAKKCGCNEHDLRNEFPELDFPIPGVFIFVYYIYDERSNSYRVLRVDK